METWESHLEVALHLLRVACDADELGPLAFALPSAKVEPVADNLAHCTRVPSRWRLVMGTESEGKLDGSVNRNGTMPRSSGGRRGLGNMGNIALLVTFASMSQEQGST